MEVQDQINLLVGGFFRINKREVQNKCLVMIGYCEIQLSVVLKELEWFLY
jgi:hypothetical protein